MIELNGQLFDPKQLSIEQLKNEIDLSRYANVEAITVYWDNTQLTQDQLFDLYHPLIQHAQSIGLDVHCQMSVREAKRLVRYPRMMFVDPLFLSKFKFKSIRFDLIDIKKINAS